MIDAHAPLTVAIEYRNCSGGALGWAYGIAVDDLDRPHTFGARTGCAVMRFYLSRAEDGTEFDAPAPHAPIPDAEIHVAPDTGAVHVPGHPGPEFDEVPTDFPEWAVLAVQAQLHALGAAS